MQTLPDLIAALGSSDLPLEFNAPGGAPGPGYHLTEVRLAQRRILDCGGVTSGDTRAELQLMAGFGRPMTAARFNAIARRALSEMPDLEAAPLVAEVPTDNGQLALVTPVSVDKDANAITVTLTSEAAACRALARAGATPGCCGSAAQTACCH